jgi:hypothetical protein
MKQSGPLRPIEPRWPVALTVFAVLLLQATLHSRIRIFPDWVSYTVGIGVILSMAAVSLTGAKARWLRVESTMILLLFVFIETAVLAALAIMIREMASQSKQIGGLQLLASSISLYVSNILSFSLLYWHLDRGGPEARMNKRRTKPDWLFSQAQVSEDEPNKWLPAFVDYLSLAFTTAASFSPANALPLTFRVKMMNMFQSAVSLTTIIFVVSRAINLLGS